VTPIDLDRFPRVPLGHWPTPLDDAPRLSAALGGVAVLLGRDDVNSLGLGGNKLRKLEYLLGRALTEGADTVITSGALQTNHGRQTATACARLGLRCELVLTAKVPRAGEAYERSGNVLLDHLFGARVHVCADAAEADRTYGRLLADAAEQGRTVATVPVGGSDATGRSVTSRPQGNCSASWPSAGSSGRGSWWPRPAAAPRRGRPSARHCCAGRSASTSPAWATRRTSRRPPRPSWPAPRPPGRAST
jgi:hypothetical protein